MQLLTFKRKLKKERRAKTRGSALNIIGLKTIHREAVTREKEVRTHGT
jgi:hypothetical protein